MGAGEHVTRVDQCASAEPTAQGTAGHNARGRMRKLLRFGAWGEFLAVAFAFDRARRSCNVVPAEKNDARASQDAEEFVFSISRA